MLPRALPLRADAEIILLWLWGAKRSRRKKIKSEIGLTSEGARGVKGGLRGHAVVLSAGS